MTFQPGQSGNPTGRPRGARGKAAVLAEQMFEGEAEAVIRAAIDLAKAGDTAAVRLCLERVAPRPQHRVVPFELPPLAWTLACAVEHFPATCARARPPRR